MSAMHLAKIRDIRIVDGIVSTMLEDPWRRQRRPRKGYTL
jgi:hypothetical protein